MSTIQEYTQMIQELFPPYAEVCTECEEREDETVLGFTVTIGSHGNELVALVPGEMVEVKEKMKAKHFFVYPTPPRCNSALQMNALNAGFAVRTVCAAGSKEIIADC